MESQESSTEKGPVRGETNPPNSSLTLLGDKPSQPGDNKISSAPTEEIPPTHHYLSFAATGETPPTHPGLSAGATATVGQPTSQPPLGIVTARPITLTLPHQTTSPLLEAIRPLTSTGLFSPPHSLPLVSLPNHPPLSPIPRDLNLHPYSGHPHCNFSPQEGLGVQGDPVALPAGQVVQDWIANLSAEPDWDPYNSSPSYLNQQQFWNSRELNGADKSSTIGRHFLSPVSRSDQQLIETNYSDIDFDADFGTCVSKETAACSNLLATLTRKHGKFLEQFRSTRFKLEINT